MLIVWEFTGPDVERSLNKRFRGLTPLPHPKKKMISDFKYDSISNINAYNFLYD